MHWFYFADEPNSDLEEKYPGIVRFPETGKENYGEITVENLLYTAVLPATGGAGILPFVLGGWAFMGTASALVYKNKRNKKKGAN